MTQPCDSTSKILKTNSKEAPLSQSEIQDEYDVNLNETKEQLEPNRMENNNMAIENDTNCNEFENKNVNNVHEDINKIVFMSDSDSSSSEGFLIVEDNSKNDEQYDKQNDSVESVINTEKTDYNNDEDLFSDIFEEEKDVKKLDEILNIGKVTEKNDIFENCGKILGEEIENNNQMTSQKVKTAPAEKEEKDFVKSQEQVNLKNSVMKENIALKEDSKEIIDTESGFKELKSSISAVPKLSISELQEMKDDLQKEKIDLLVAKSSKERLATNISDQMYQEAQVMIQH